MAWVIKPPNHEVSRGLGVQIEPPDVHHPLITPLFSTQLVFTQAKPPAIAPATSRLLVSYLHSNHTRPHHLFHEKGSSNGRPQNTANGQRLGRFVLNSPAESSGFWKRSTKRNVRPPHTHGLAKRVPHDQKHFLHF
eukprot:g70468.t1